MRHKLLYFSYRKELLDPQLDIVTTVVALGCSKSRGPSTSGNCSGFCNLLDGICSLYLGKNVGVAKNGVIGASMSEPHSSVYYSDLKL